MAQQTSFVASPHFKSGILDKARKTYLARTPYLILTQSDSARTHRTKPNASQSHEWRWLRYGGQFAADFLKKNSPRTGQFFCTTDSHSTCHVAALIFHLSSLPDDGCEIEQSVLLGVRFGFRPFQSSPSSSSFFPFAFSLIDDESTFANGLARPGGSARCYEPIWRRSAKTGDYKFEPKKNPPPAWPAIKKSLLWISPAADGDVFMIWSSNERSMRPREPHGTHSNSAKPN